MTLVKNIGITVCLGGLSCLIFTPPALAVRYVLNQTPLTIERYFGKPIKTEGYNPNHQVYTYSIVQLKRILPNLPRNATFGMTFINGRVSDIWLYPNASSEKEAYSFGQPSAVKLYRYIFGYNPPLWKKIDLPNGGSGHEGFLDYKFCLGDGVGITFISYMWGENNIRLLSSEKSCLCQTLVG